MLKKQVKAVRKEVKAECRKILVEKWWSIPLLANIFLMLVSIIFNPEKIYKFKGIITNSDGIVSVTKTTFAGFSVLNFGISIFYYLAIFALSLGFTRLVYNYFSDKNQRFSSIFYYFSTPQKFFSAIWLHLNVALRVLLWCLPMSLILFVYWYTNATLNPIFKASRFSNWFFAFLMVAYLIFLVVIINRYSLAQVIFIKNDGKLTVNQSVKLSIKITKGRLGELFVLGLSLIPVSFLAIFIITAPFVSMYTTFVCTLYYKRMLENYEKNTEVIDIPAEVVEEEK